jgi:hypothetical protein
MWTEDWTPYAITVQFMFGYPSGARVYQGRWGEVEISFDISLNASRGGASSSSYADILMRFGFEIIEHDDDDGVTLKLMNKEVLGQDLEFKNHFHMKDIKVDDAFDLDSSIYPKIINVFNDKEIEKSWTSWLGWK